MAYSDAWFVVDENRRGTLKGFANGAAEVDGAGGFFEVAVIFRHSEVPVQQVVRVYFDKWTPVYAEGSERGTVLSGLTGQDGYNVRTSNRLLEVPFHVNGGQLNAERVNVLEEAAP